METEICTDVLQCETRDTIKYCQGIILRDNDTYYFQTSWWQDNNDIQFTEPRLVNKQYYKEFMWNESLPHDLTDVSDEYFAYVILKTFFNNKIEKGYHRPIKQEISVIKSLVKLGE